MKRYSIAPSSSRRKSTINPSLNDDTAASRAELEKLEQETTLVLQEIDKNLSRANAIINDRIFPILKEYSKSSENVWNNVGFWKYFFEQSANVELSSYEARANVTNEVNTITNTKNNLLLSDDDDNDEQEQEQEREQDEAETRTTERPATKVDLFKKPFLKATIEESTPTWSTEQPKTQSIRQLQSSTPQLQKRPSLLSGYNKPATRFNSYDSIGMQPPPVLSNTLTSSELTNTHSPMKKTNIGHSPVKTQTIRQSLDNYHRISMSPRKNETPARSIVSEDARRRSSMIQNLIDSSPTLPEPPVLQSEIGHINSGGNSDERESSSSISQPSKSYERFSPVLLPPELSPIKSNTTIQKTDTIQRFPTTPNFSRAGDDKGIDIMRTPLGVRIRFGGDDSDLPAPELQNNPTSVKDTNNQNIPLHEDELDVPLPDLETIDLTNKKKRNIPNDNPAESRKKYKLPGDDDDENVFLDNTANKNNSVASTVYHSIMNQQDNVSNQSKDDTANHSRSRSISHLFEEVLINISNSKTDSNNTNNQEKRFSQAKDLFGDLTTTQHENLTENSTSELGSLLGERYKNLTNYNQKE